MEQFIYKTQYTSQTERPFRCAQCNFSGVARIHAQGIGIASSDHGGDARARKTATDAATAQAQMTFDVNLKFARCPKCGERRDADVAAMRRVSRIFATGSLAGAAVGLTLLIAGLALSTFALAMTGALVSLIGSIFAVVGRVTPSRTLARADRDVQIVPALDG